VSPPQPFVAAMRPEEEACWDRFVQGHEYGSPFHLIAWKKVIEESFGYEPHYLTVKRGGEITAVLPLFVVHNFLSGTVLLSTPFAVYGGVLAADPASRDALKKHIHELGIEMNAQYVELRNGEEGQCLGFSRLSRYVTFRQVVGPDEREILDAIPRKTRAAVRKSLKAGLETVILTEMSGIFKDLYARNLRRLGTPSFPDQYFESISQHFHGSTDIREVRHGQKTVSAVLSLYFRDRMFPYCGASDPAFSTLSPNNFMYYDQMRWGGTNGYRMFDFGRSKKSGSGSYDFKAHWGMTESELPYEILLIKRKELPNFTPTNKTFDLPMRVWRKLPLSLTRKIGPRLLRLFP
jgi:FemAB-related protein (PEP-CTERM system-associated)